MAQWIRDSSSDPRTYIKAKLCITASCNVGTQEAETVIPQPGELGYPESTSSRFKRSYSVIREWLTRALSINFKPTHTHAFTDICMLTHVNMHTLMNHTTHLHAKIKR